MDSYRERLIYYGRPKHFYPYVGLDQGILETARTKAVGWPRHFRIIDPNNELLSTVYNNLKVLGDPDAFQIFTLVCRACDHMLGVAFGDGSLGAGVANELAAMYRYGDTRIGRQVVTWTAVPLRRQDNLNSGSLAMPAIYRHTSYGSIKETHKILTIPETRERIKNGVL
jgi:hypothetical protein